MIPTDNLNPITTPDTTVASEANKVAPPQRLEIHIPWVTFIKVCAALLAGYAIYVLWPLLLLIFLALFLAVTLHSFVDWLDAKGMRHWLSLTIVISGLLTVLSLGMALIVPTLIDQAANFTQNFPKLREDTLTQLPVSGAIRLKLEHMLDSVDLSKANTWIGHLMSAGGLALGGLSQIILLLVIAIYMLIDGAKTYAWMLAFFSPFNRRKLHATSEEISTVIFGYVSGQVITSVLVMVYSYAVLSWLQVPGALMLAILAGILDVMPILGFIIATVPAVLLALSVSPKTGLLVLSLYLLFHAFENYFIVPKVYGKSLRLSTLSVLLGLLAGTLLAGIPGALAALPVIASYAAIERIWLKDFLRDGVSEKHEQQKDQVFGERT